MANQIKLVVSERTLAESTETGYSRLDIIQYNVNVDKINVEFDSEWADLEKVATFETDDVKIVAPYQDWMYIPWENLCDCGRLYITLTGYDDGVAVINTQRMVKPLIIEESAPNEGTKPQDPTRSILIRALAASKYIEGMTVSCTTLPAGSAPTVTIDKTNPNGYAIAFGIPSGSAGVTEHDKLTNRELADSHPISAITDLVDTLAAKYVKPSGGVPKSDLDSSVAATLDKADSQPAIPTAVKNKYLHANETTGNLEWETPEGKAYTAGDGIAISSANVISTDNSQESDIDEIFDASITALTHPKSNIVLEGIKYFYTKIKDTLQEKLVSGTNIKTFNSQSILGSGDIFSSMSNLDVFSFEVDEDGNLCVLATADTMSKYQFSLESGKLVIQYTI